MKVKWNIYRELNISSMLQLIESSELLAGAFDTETTGLNIKHDKPFLFQCGFVTKSLEGFVWIVDLTKQPTADNFIKTWYTRAKDFPVYLAHNTKFDLHMMLNHGLPYGYKNISDTMFYIRYGCDHIPERFGGPPLGLKKFTKKYIEPLADKNEKEIKDYRAHIARNLNAKLRTRLASAQSNYKSTWEKMEDITTDIANIHPTASEAIREWINLDLPLALREKQRHPHSLSYNEIPYNMVPSDIMYKYAANDIVYTLEIFVELAPIVEKRGNMPGLQIENDLIYPLMRMERIGLKMDVEKLEECRLRLKETIQLNRDKLFQLTGQNVKVGQHALIKHILEHMLNTTVESTSNEHLSRLKDDLQRLNQCPKVIEFIDTLQNLRTLEKWYSVYITKFIQDLDEDGRIYTQLGQVGAATGRFTSDFQQFPKGGIEQDVNFIPRQLVIPHSEEYDMVFIDYSQIELRLQAMYTMLVGHPDLHMCRAYMPYKCIEKEGHYYYEENQMEEWSPTDIHGVTTTAATGLRPEDPGFKRARSDIGKRLNFAKNYGAGWSRVRTMFPDKTPEEIDRINSAYYDSYPGVRKYHDYCTERAVAFNYTENLFGIRYYNVSGHKLRNMLIQGSSAYLLKLKIIEIDKYIKEHKLKTRMQLQIHDELMFIWHKDEYEHIPKIKAIMEDWDDTLVPIVAEVSYSTTNWHEKKEYNESRD